MSIKEEMERLINELNKHTKLYDLGTPEISDREWDEMYFTLQGMEEQTGIVLPNSPTQKVNYEVVNELKKVTHNHDMLSLDKTKDMHDVYHFLGNRDFLTMCKMDGLTCSLRYIDGKLVSAETRGNGYVGEDVLHNAMVIPSIPKKINYKDELIVDGEIICTYQDFELFKDEYRHPRNFASGSIRLLDSKECEKRKLTFVAWDVIYGFENENSLFTKLGLLIDLGFKTVPCVPTDDWDAKEFVQNQAKEHGYPIDGLVFKFNNVEYGRSLGKTSHHGKNAIAYKFYDELYDTRLRDIEWSIGRTGVLTPVAIFDPVEIDFTWVERASLHNVSVLHSILGSIPYKGQTLKVFKANMIIPQIESADKEKMPGNDADYIWEPYDCPYCGQHLEEIKENDSTVLKCTNDKCAGKKLYSLVYFCSKSGLDIKYINEILLDKLIKFGYINTYKDIFLLYNHAKELANKPEWGTRGTARIITSIEESKHTTLEKFISAIGIPLIGPSVAKDIAKIFKNYKAFRDAIDNNYDFTTIERFGQARADAITTFDYTEADEVYDYLDIAEEAVEAVEQNLDGYKIVITGSLTNFANRDELTKIIESRGGKVVGSVSKNTTLLINNDITSTSGKNKTAKELNIPILDENTFITKYLN